MTCSATSCAWRRGSRSRSPAAPRPSSTLDLAEAQAIIDGDHEINELTLDIEERCFTILARQQPMASDMRAVVTAIRLTSEIERSGDLMVNVAKATRRLYGSPIPPALHGLLQAMSDEAVRLYRLAMDAYADGDATLAGALDDMDDRLDQIHKDYIQAILELYADCARRACGRPARAGGSLLRAHRRPCRQHRPAGGVHGHRLAPRAHRRLQRRRTRMMLTLLLRRRGAVPGHDPRPRVRRSEATREPPAGRRPAPVRRHRAERHRPRRGDVGGRALGRSRAGVGRRRVHRRGAAGERAGGDPARRRGVRRRRRDRLPETPWLRATSPRGMAMRSWRRRSPSSPRSPRPPATGSLRGRSSCSVHRDEPSCSTRSRCRRRVVGWASSWSSTTSPTGVASKGCVATSWRTSATS